MRKRRAFLASVALLLPFAAACSEEAPVTAPVTAAADLAAPVAPEVQPAAYQPPAPARPAEDFPVAGILQLDAPIAPGDYAWNDEGVPEGPTTIVVDLEWQRIYVYRAGVEIGRASLIYGADDKPTPTGIFPILEKDADHVSNLYDAPMPFMLRLTMDGVAIHASTVESNSATHGCVGIPYEFAEMLFAEAQLGERVLVTNGWRRDIYGAAATASTTT